MTERLRKIRRRVRLPGSEPKLSDVARAAGVSTASVSRALTRPELVSEVLRSQVLRAVAEQGYVANASARALSIRRSHLIGLVVGSMEDAVVRLAADGFVLRLEENGYGVVLAVGDGGAEESLRLCRSVLARGVDALALGGVDRSRDLARHLRKAPLFLAYLDQRNGDGRTVGFSREQALELSVRYLHELGHRRIGLVEPGRGCPRLAWDDACRGSGLTPVRLPLADEDAHGGSLGASLRAWLGDANPPSAVVCGNDAVAAAVLRACEEQGVNVPGRLSVTGLGDSQIASWTRPTLTSLRIPALEAGAAAADCLLAALRGEPYEGPILKAKLIVRASTGPP